MDITQDNFKENLLKILSNIATSDFVTLDLQVSGTASRAADTPRHDVPDAPGPLRRRPRAAARQFQVLQLGLTCAQESDGSPTQTFLLRTYNMDVSPLVSENVDLDRSFDLQSTAISALTRAGFDMAAPFRTGVRYLSRAEEAVARLRVGLRATSEDAALPDIKLGAADARDRAFVERVRGEVRE